MRHLASASLSASILLAGCGASSTAPAATTSPPAEGPAAAAPVAPQAGHNEHEGHEAHGGHGAAATTPGTPAPTTAKSVSFAWPQAGSTVFSEFDVAFGMAGMGLRKAGEDVTDKSSGHHHLIIDDAGIALGQPVPKDDRHLHFGDASTTAHVKLAPGEHTLIAQLADGAHLSYGPELSATMKVKVVPAPAKIGVSFANLAEGAVVKNPVLVKFAVDGFTLRPAGEDVLDKTSGHHHLIIDGAPEPLGSVVGRDATHLHFGKAETETTITLTPGEHTLTLQLADGAHMSYGPALAKTIKVKAE